MGLYEITWYSKNLMMTDQWTAKTVWEAIDQLLEEGLAYYHTVPIYLDIVIIRK